MAGWLAGCSPAGRLDFLLLCSATNTLPARCLANPPCLPTHPACLQGHLARVGEERCAFVRAMVFANRAMQSRAALQREADNWLGEAGTLPPGNGAEAEVWEGAAAAAGGASVDTSLMTPAELAEYEEKKLKMRKVGAGDGAVRGLLLVPLIGGRGWVRRATQTENTLCQGLPRLRLLLPSLKCRSGPSTAHTLGCLIGC